LGENRKALAFSGRIVMVGFGSIGQGTLPLLLRHIDLRPAQIVIFTGDENGRQVAEEYGVEFNVIPLTRANYRSVLEPRLSRGDFLVNCSTDVSSVALISLCQERGVLYIDTCIEPWAGGYTDISVPPEARSNYALREAALALKRPGMPTAILTHGANPGMVSHLVKEALLNIARDWAGRSMPPATASAGRGWRSRSTSAPSTSPSATRRWPSRARRRTSSSTPGRSTVSSARAASRLSWAGAATSAFPAGRPPPRLRLPGGDHADAAGRLDAGAHLDAAGRADPRLPDHPQRSDLDRRLPDARRGRQPGLPADGALCLPPLRRHGALGARTGRPQLADAAAHSAW
jgi:hypothetical protein